MTRPLERDKRHPIGGKVIGRKKGSVPEIPFVEAKQSTGCLGGPLRGGAEEAVGCLTLRLLCPTHSCPGPLLPCPSRVPALEEENAKDTFWGQILNPSLHKSGGFQ